MLNVEMQHVVIISASTRSGARQRHALMNHLTPRSQQSWRCKQVGPGGFNQTTCGRTLFARTDKLGQGVAVKRGAKLGLDLEIAFRKEVEKLRPRPAQQPLMR